LISVSGEGKNFWKRGWTGGNQKTEPFDQWVNAAPPDDLCLKRFNP
jgi:hypothetical protein